MLARTVAGRLDVDAMLEEMTPDQFEGWYAAYRLSPWGDEYKRTSLIASEICNSIRGVAMGFGKQAMSEDDFLDLDHYVPKWFKKDEEPERLKIKKTIEAAKSLEGFGW